MKRPKYIAVCNPVHEVTIRGAADLRFWTNKLAGQNLQPTERDGKAQILIIAGNMKYMGIEFTEVSFSVEISPSPLAPGRNAVVIGHAFNSSRIFTFCERTFFATPYSHAKCKLSTSLPAMIEVEQHGDTIFCARMSSSTANERTSAEISEQEWEGQIFLPCNPRRLAAKQQLYFAMLKGQTRTCPFIPMEDTLTIGHTRENDVFESLRGSNFTPTEWLIRENATHARTKTVRVPMRNA